MTSSEQVAVTERIENKNFSFDKIFLSSIQRTYRRSKRQNRGRKVHVRCLLEFCIRRYSCRYLSKGEENEIPLVRRKLTGLPLRLRSLDRHSSSTGTGKKFNTKNTKHYLLLQITKFLTLTFSLLEFPESFASINKIRSITPNIVILQHWHRHHTTHHQP